MRRKRYLTITLEDLAERLGARLEGCDRPDAVELTGLSTLEEASASDLSFVTGAQYVSEAARSRAAAFLVPENAVVESRPCLVVGNVWKSVLAAQDLWHPEEPAPAGVHPSAVVDPAARIGEGVAVGPLTVIEAGAGVGDNAEIGAQCFIGRDARIGPGCLLHPGVRVLERVRVGRNVILHSGVVLGADGFGYEIIDGRGVKIPQVGTVVIEDDVEIGANTCVDRAFLTETRVGEGTKMDNLVQIAHNCRVGRSCGFAAQAALGGSTRVGDGCMFWGQAAAADHVTIGDGAVVLGQAGVKPRDAVPSGERVFGTPAMPARQFARILTAQRQLPDLVKRLRALEARIEEMERGGQAT